MIRLREALEQPIVTLHLEPEEASVVLHLINMIARIEQYRTVIQRRQEDGELRCVVHWERLQQKFDSALKHPSAICVHESQTDCRITADLDLI